MTLLQNIYLCRAFWVSRGGQTGPPPPKGHGKSWLPAVDKNARRDKSFRKNKKKEKKPTRAWIRAALNLDPAVAVDPPPSIGSAATLTRRTARGRGRAGVGATPTGSAPPSIGWEGDDAPPWIRDVAAGWGRPSVDPCRRGGLGPPLRGSVPSRRVGAAPPWIRAGRATPLLATVRGGAPIVAARHRRRGSARVRV